MKKSLVGLSALLLLLLAGCAENDAKKSDDNTDKGSKIEATTKNKSTEQSTTTNSSKKKVERNAQKELSDEEVKNRVVAYFSEKEADTADVKFMDAVQSAWRELEGRTILTGFIDVNKKPKWNLQIELNGKVTATKSAISEDSNQEEQVSFNIFDITSEQLQKADYKNTRAQKLSDDELNRRIIAWFADGNTMKPIQANKIAVYPEQKVGWINSEGTKVFVTTIYITLEEVWNIEVTGNGDAYLVKYQSNYELGSISSEGTPVFNIFNITDEQLKKVDEAKTNQLSVESMNQTELAQRLIVLLNKKVFPDSTIEDFEDNGYINLNSSEYGITYENVFYREGIRHQIQNTFIVDSNGDVAITSVQSGETVRANVFNDVEDSEWQSVRNDITQPNEDIKEG